MDKQPPPSYQQSEAMSNPHYSGPNPIYPNLSNVDQDQHDQKKKQNPQLPPYQAENFQQATYVTAIQHPGSSVHAVGSSGVPVTIVTQQYLGPKPTSAWCHKCNETVTTSVKSEANLLAWCIAGGLCILGCWFGCCLIPFCMDSCRDAFHSCPKCNTFLGRYSKINNVQ